MKTSAAVLWDRHQELEVEEVELDAPKQAEVLVKDDGQRVVSH